MITKTYKNVNRVAVYNDGNNLFNGIYAERWFDLLWLDLQALGNTLAGMLTGTGKHLGKKQEVTAVKHFTCRPCAKHSMGKYKLPLYQSFIGANALSDKVSIIEGKFVHRADWPGGHAEKESDANLAAHLTYDACMNNFDTAILVSGDTDFSGAIRFLRQKFRNKAFIVASPPGRLTLARRLKAKRQPSLRIRRKTLQRCLLPNIVSDTLRGVDYHRPQDDAWAGNINMPGI